MGSIADDVKSLRDLEDRSLSLLQNTEGKTLINFSFKNTTIIRHYASYLFKCILTPTIHQWQVFCFHSLHFIYNILLTWYSGHILDDQDLVDTLQQSKGKSSEITNRVAQSEETEKKLNLARKRYLPVSLTEVFSQRLFEERIVLISSTAKVQIWITENQIFTLGLD